MFLIYHIHDVSTIHLLELFFLFFIYLRVTRPRKVSLQDFFSVRYESGVFYFRPESCLGGTPMKEWLADFENLFIGNGRK